MLTKVFNKLFLLIPLFGARQIFSLEVIPWDHSLLWKKLLPPYGHIKAGRF